MITAPVDWIGPDPQPEWISKSEQAAREQPALIDPSEAEIARRAAKIRAMRDRGESTTTVALEPVKSKGFVSKH